MTGQAGKAGESGPEKPVPQPFIIQPRKGLALFDVKELWAYRELLYFLTKRDIKIRYRQTILGGAWAVLQPFLTMVVFSVFFGRMLQVPSDGLPYPLFVYAGLVAWTYFSNSITMSGNSLVGNAQLISKMYCPRVIIPAASCIAGLLDFVISMVVLFGMMAYYGFAPGLGVLLLPLLMALTFLCALGAGLWLSAANVKYRDIRYAIPFLIQLWMFVSPVIYPVNLVSEKYQWILALNPMGGVIKAYRACLLGNLPIDWFLLGLSSAMILVLFLSGLMYFKNVEKSFADVI